MTLTVTSTSFDDGAAMPHSTAHTMAGGGHSSPDLSWSGAPDGTKSFAVTCYDPDAPTPTGFVHWVMFNIDAATTTLAEGAGTPDTAPPGAVVGLSDWGDNQFCGVAPPPGDPPHNYKFTVFALGDVLPLDAATTYAKLHFVMKDLVLDEGSLTGTFALG